MLEEEAGVDPKSVETIDVSSGDSDSDYDGGESDGTVDLTNSPEIARAVERTFNLVNSAPDSFDDQIENFIESPPSPPLRLRLRSFVLQQRQSKPLDGQRQKAQSPKRSPVKCAKKNVVVTPLRLRLRSSVRCQQQSKPDDGQQRRQAKSSKRNPLKRLKNSVVVKPKPPAANRSEKVVIKEGTIKTSRPIGGWKAIVALLSAADIRRYRFACLTRLQKKNEDDDMGALLEAALGEQNDGGADNIEHDLDAFQASAAQTWAQEKSKFDHIFGTKKKVGSSAIRGGNKKKETPKRKVNDSALVAASRKVIESAPVHAPSTPRPVLSNNAQEAQPVVAKRKSIFRLVINGETCRFCDHVCGPSSPLKRHLDRHHQFRCESCVVQFDNLKAIKAHRKHVHQTRIRCNLCEKDYLSEKKYKSHFKTILHQRLAKAQATMYNTMVEKWNSSKSGKTGLRVLQKQEVDDLISGKTVKDELISGTSNIQTRHGGVIEMFLEQAEEAENEMEVDPEFEEGRSSFVAPSHRFDHLSNGNPLQAESYVNQGIRPDPVEDQPLFDPHPPRPRSTNLFPDFHTTHPVRENPLSLASAHASAPSFKFINNIPRANLSTVATYSNVAQMALSGGAVICDSRRSMIRQDEITRSGAATIMEQIKQAFQRSSGDIQEQASELGLWDDSVAVPGSENVLMSSSTMQEEPSPTESIPSTTLTLDDLDDLTSNGSDHAPDWSRTNSSNYGVGELAPILSSVDVYQSSDGGEMSEFINALLPNANDNVSFFGNDEQHQEEDFCFMNL